MTAPLRFLSAVIGLWCLGRAGVLLWPEGAFLPVAAAPAGPPAVLLAAPAQAATVPAIAVPRAEPPALQARLAVVAATSALAEPAPSRPVPHARQAMPVSSSAPASASIIGALAPPSPSSLRSSSLPPSPRPAAIAGPVRSGLLAGVTVSSWALWRPGEGGSVGFGAGTLGGSQAGVRALVPILGDRVPRLALSARVSAPLRRRGGEAAVGVEWQPAANLPVRVLAERRQRIAGDGRSAFALLAHGGVSERRLAHGLALDAYGAAGVVGARSRDLFAEGAATVTHALGPVRVGAGGWGGAQRGTSRLDVGPTLAVPLRVGDAGVRVSLDYRLRVAGDAAPGSGPALTVGAGF